MRTSNPTVTMVGAAISVTYSEIQACAYCGAEADGTRVTQMENGMIATAYLCAKDMAGEKQACKSNGITIEKDGERSVISAS